MMFRMICEQSERKKEKEIKRFGHKKIIGPRPLGGSPPLDPLVSINTTIIY